MASMEEHNGPVSPSTRSNELQGQGIELLRQYRETGRADDLRTGSELVEAAFDASPDYYEHGGMMKLFQIGSSYYRRYKMNRLMADLDIAIRLLGSASSRAPKTHPIRLHSLLTEGIAHGLRANRTGAMDDFDAGIRTLEDALNALTTIPDNEELRGFILHNLATLHGNKHLNRSAWADLEACIQRYQEALDATPNDAVNQDVRARRLAALGTANKGKFERTGSFADLNLAIELLQEALELSPAEDEDRSAVLLQIADLRQVRFTKTGDMADLDIVIRRSEEALLLPQKDVSYRARCLGRLGFGQLAKYDHGSPEDRTLDRLNTAIHMFEEALNITPDDDVLRCAYLQGCSRAEGLRFLKQDCWTDHKLAVQRARESINNTSSSIANRLKPALQLIVLYTGAQMWQDAYEVACTAMSLISLLAPRSLRNSDKQHLLREDIGRLASNAAAVALGAGKQPYEAIRLLELGRGVIVNSLYESRVDISNLQEKYPRLAADYLRYQAQLGSTPESFPNKQPYHAEQQLAEVLENIRRQPGFSHFLLPPTEDQMKETASKGPVVIINVSFNGCHALIIQEKKSPTSLPLPLLRYEVVMSRSRYTPTDPELLEWLWHTIAEPVLDALGFTQTPPNDRWPHIWWIPTGPLVRLPLHAAGCHTDGSRKAVLDRVISSYSSSVQILIYSRRKRHPDSATKPSKLVLVAMPETAGQRDLLHVPTEVAQLKRICKAADVDIIEPQPRREEVIAALRGCDVFHFAGHGHAHPQDPAKSSLLLRDGPLTVESFFDDADGNFRRDRSSAPVLAYLSACGTGQVRDAGLIDEGMHLISACQLAGFRHVVGTLWEVNDQSCADVAAVVYEWIMKDAAGVSDDSVSEGLHHAVHSLRTSWISHNKTSGALRQYLGTRGQDKGEGGNPTFQGGKGNEEQSQSREKDSRYVEECEDERLSPLHWVPYIHFGI
jgi:CHAT domain-containing protein/tetratricopeptide (TPR) repeat protein